MAGGSREKQKLAFVQKLVLNQWLISLFHPDVMLNSFILSPTPYQGILWMPKPLKGWLADHHVLFMEDGGAVYLKELFERLQTT